MIINNKKNIGKILFVILVTSCVFLAFALFISNNHKRALSLGKNYLKDATVQSAQRIDDVLDSAQKELSISADLFEEIINGSNVNTENLKEIRDKSTFDYIEYIDVNGIDFNQEGISSDVSEKLYYQDGIKGNSGIDFVFNLNASDDNIIILYTPLYYNNEIIGVLTGHYKESKIIEILNSTFFDENARTFLCLKDGTVIASCNGDFLSKNIFDKGNFNKDLDPDVENELRNALITGEKYEFQYEGTKGTANAYVIALEKMDWILIQTFPSQITNNIINNANKAGILLLAELIGIFAVCIVFIYISNMIQKKKIILENTEKSYVINGITQLYGSFVLVNFEDDTYKYLAETKPRFPNFSSHGNYNSLKDFIIYMAKDQDDKKYLEKTLDKENLQKIFNEDNSHLRYEYPIKDYKEKWDSLNIICLKRVNGIPTEILFTYQDVTKVKQRELRNYEALKEAYQAVESANQAKSNFLSNMSHDIRTPMNAIVGFCTLIQRDAENPVLVREHTRKITASGQHLLGLINDVLDMSKIESGKTVLNITEINLAEIVEEIETIIRSQSKAKKQIFEISVIDVRTEHLLGDKLRINQILINILSNAVKYTQIGGKIEMIIRQMPQTSKNYANLQFTIRDNGMGMSEEYVKTIFNPFTREINSTTNQVQGTGLGMAITKNLVDLMGGTIKVESKSGKGSVFTVDLELRMQEHEIDQNFWVKNGVTNTLIVDDEPDICNSIITAMAGTGVSLQYAVDGNSAIKLIEKAHKIGRDFDLLLIDWKMPDMDGIETARRIRKIIPSNVTIMILTAYDWSEIEEEAITAGIDGFLPKPFFISNFKQTIENLRNKSSIDITETSNSIIKGKHILAAEDNELNSEILVELLKIVGGECDVVENGKEALNRFISSAPGEYDFILMDVQMPVMNGYDAVREIRKSSHPNAKNIPIIAMTANAFAEDVKNALDSGMNAHVSKPIDLRKIELVLKEIYLGK